MSKPKANKRVPDSNNRILGNKKQTPKPVYQYRYEEMETTAVEAVYNYLFDKLTGASQSADP